jgi:hypothetical protein
VNFRPPIGYGVSSRPAEGALAVLDLTSRRLRMAARKRTTHRSSTGKKLYAVRDSGGRFKDIQTYERAHRADLARGAKAEGARKAAKKKAAGKKGAKKSAKRK